MHIHTVLDDLQPDDKGGEGYQKICNIRVDDEKTGNIPIHTYNRKSANIVKGKIRT